MVSSLTGGYASSRLPASKDEPGVYFPDSVVAPLVEEACRVVPNIFEAHVRQPEFALLQTAAPVIRDPVIPIERSKQLVIDALTAFDPSLGKKAKEIFDAGFDKAVKNNVIEDLKSKTITEDTSQWRMRKVDPGEGCIMRSLPANSPASELDPANPNPRAVIQFEYDRTINDAIYLAHEVGHSIADDYIRGREGVKFGDNPKYLDEFQAYVTQNIMYDYLKQHKDPAIARAAEQHYTATMAQNLYQIPIAVSAMEAQKGASANSDALLKSCFGSDLQQYKPAQQISDSIKGASGDSKFVSAADNAKPKAKTKAKLNDAVEGLHSRPVSIMLASGLVNQMLGQDQQTRHRITETLLGRDGVKSIVDVLDSAGIKSEGDVKRLAQSAIKTTIAPIRLAQKSDRVLASTPSQRQPSAKKPSHCL